MIGSIQRVFVANELHPARCNSVKTKECANAIPPESLRQNCSQHESGVRYILCRKITQHVDYGINGELPQNRIIRTCGWDETKYKLQLWTCNEFPHLLYRLMALCHLNPSLALVSIFKGVRIRGYDEI
ncbi:hypothetical protein EVAR_78317_1 [Eumeta japonica]|uniref:Uncharacterized protein n=1 Tax=Eumeta variegata TaxID=151549 RepID=A0A4C1T645_EUMVA|nr:hypothetical protein EVAR_78317_1 [Eumeta japonica]